MTSAVATSDVPLAAGSDVEGALGAGTGAGGLSQPLFRRIAEVFTTAVVAGMEPRSK